MIKNICFFTTNFEYPRQIMFSYYEKILPKNIKLFLFCKGGDKNKFKVKRTKKINYFNNKLSIILRLRKFCKENRIDILTNLSGSTKIATTLVLATFLTKTKNIYYNHGNPPFSSYLGLIPIQFFLNRILFCTQDVVKKTKKYLCFSRKNIFKLAPALNVYLFKPKNKKQCRKTLKIKSKEKTIIFVGRIQYMKGSDYLLKLIKRNPDKKFILIGSIMDNEYKKENLKNLFIIPKTDLNNLINYYNVSDLCLFLSRGEGYGLVPREAMSCGIPTMISDIESLRNLEQTIIVPFNIDKIQEKIDWFFNLSEKEKKKLSKKSRDLIIKEYSEEALKSKHLKYFLEF